MCICYLNNNELACMKYYEGERSCIHFVNNDEKVISKLVM